MLITNLPSLYRCKWYFECDGKRNEHRQCQEYCYQNDKGRLSQAEIDRMVNEAERYADEEDENSVNE
ncbi:Major heat shock 70 kDa protein Ab [Eumeta japonica]|uniref:Major heat shock 70 kDa protein Ab n=1 Tax=Eumeta variegata TaxID=151549 RepID=A0A4C1SMQ4_EUMVA|nr:Major heat shock 70 kDa protein Ab [Eumeta japonica]